VLPEGLAAVLDPTSWDRGPAFAWLEEQGVSEDEQRRVFNLGIGMCAVIPEADVGPDDIVIGRLESAERSVTFA
jgi:phosphoribosylformylglycinamidine cyclo-ligase